MGCFWAKSWFENCCMSRWQLSFKWWCQISVDTYLFKRCLQWWLERLQRRIIQSNIWWKLWYKSHEYISRHWTVAWSIKRCQFLYRKYGKIYSNLWQGKQPTKDKYCKIQCKFQWICTASITKQCNDSYCGNIQYKDRWNGYRIWRSIILFDNSCNESVKQLSKWQSYFICQRKILCPSNQWWKRCESDTWFMVSGNSWYIKIFCWMDGIWLYWFKENVCQSWYDKQQQALFFGRCQVWNLWRWQSCSRIDYRCQWLCKIITSFRR